MISRRHALRGLETVFLIAFGAFVGANGRYFVGQFIASTLLSTAAVNVAGSFGLGALTQEAHIIGVFSRRSHLVLGTGFLSSFTTYSTFVLDAVTAAPMVGLVYVLGSYALGFIGATMGRLTVSELSTADRARSEA